MHRSTEMSEGAIAYRPISDMSQYFLFFETEAEHETVTQVYNANLIQGSALEAAIRFEQRINTKSPPPTRRAAKGGRLKVTFYILGKQLCHFNRTKHGCQVMSAPTFAYETLNPDPVNIP